MNYIIGIISASLCGYNNVKSKQLLEKEDMGSYLKAYYLLRLCMCLPIIGMIIYSKQNTEISRHYGNATIIVLIIYLMARIISNHAQVKLAAVEEMDVGLSTTILTTSCFLSLILAKEPMSIIQVLMILLAVTGVILATVNIRHMKFTIPKKCILYIIVAYVTSGTKVFMASRLLLTFTSWELVVFEILNYFIVYWTIYRKVKIDRRLLVKLIPLVLISVITLCLDYLVYSEVKVYIITSFVSSIVATIASVLILKRKVAKEVYIGILIISIAVILFRL